MICKEEGLFYLICDGCGDDAGSPYKSFNQALQHSKKDGWVKKLDRFGDWNNYCQRCDEEGIK